MSRRVRARLDEPNLTVLADHELRVELDREIERFYGGYCDTVIDKVSDEELKALVYATILLERDGDSVRATKLSTGQSVLASLSRTGLN